jgi:hypothetical protein
VEQQVEMALHHALSLARARGGQLAAVTLRGAEHSGHSLLEMARRVLTRLGHEVEVIVQPGFGAVELVSIELLPRRPGGR